MKTLPLTLLLAALVSSPAPAADLTWDNGAANDLWDTTSANWTGATWSNAAPDSAIFGATGTGTVTLGENINVGDITFDAAGYDITGAPDLTLSAPTTITANADATISAQMIGAGGLIKAGTGTLFSSARHGYEGGTTVNGGILQIDGGGGSTGAIRGTLTINDGGTVQLNTGDAFGWNTSEPHVGTININDTGVLHRIGGGNETLANVAIVMDGGTISASAAAQHYDLFSGNSSVTANNASAIPGRESVISAQMDLRQANTVFTVNDDAVLRMAHINQDTAGAILTKEGNGRMLLTGGADHTGNTVINGGTFAMSSGLNNASEVHINAGATLELQATNIFLRTATDASVIIDGGTLTMIAGGPNHNKFGNMTLMNGAVWTTEAGTNAWDGENYVIRPGSTVTVGGTSPSTMSAEDGVNIGEAGGIITFDVADVTGDSAPDLLVNTELEQGGSLTKTGAGTMQLGVGASYTGPTTVTGGTLLVNSSLRNTPSLTVETGATLEMGATNILVGNHGTALPETRVITANGGTILMNSAFDSRFGSVTLNDGATWTSNRALDNWDALLANVDTGAATVTVGGTGTSTMNGSGGIHLQGVQNFDVADVTGDSSADLIVDMVLDNGGAAGGAPGGIYKTGAGTMLLNASNTYSGITTVAEGAIGGTGSSNSTLTVAGGATLAPGASIGTFTITGDATIDVNGTLAFELDGADSDLLVVSGILSIAGSTLDITDLGGGWTEDVYVVAEYGSLSGTFATVTGVDPIYTLVYDYAGGTQIAIIPETSAALLAALGALGLLIRRR